GSDLRRTDAGNRGRYHRRIERQRHHLARTSHARRPPTGRTHSADRCLQATAKPPIPAEYPSPCSSIRLPPSLPPSTISGSAEECGGRQRDVGRTSGANRATNYRKSPECHSPKSSSPSSASSRRTARPALDAGCALAGSHTRNPESPPHKSD